MLHTSLSLQSNGGSYYPLNHPPCHMPYRYLSSYGFISQIIELGLTEHKWLISCHSIKKWWDLLIAVILLIYTDLFSISPYLLIYRSNRNFINCKSRIKLIAETFFSYGKCMMHSKLTTHNIGHENGKEIILLFRVLELCPDIDTILERWLWLTTDVIKFWNF